MTALGALTGIYSDPPVEDFEKALQYAEELVKDNPDDTKNMYAMANLYEKFNRVDEAEATYLRVVRDNPDDPKACGALSAFYNKPLWDRDGNVWTEESEGAAGVTVRGRHPDHGALRHPRPQRPQRLLQGRDVLLGQGLPGPLDQREGKERVRRSRDRGRGQGPRRSSRTTGRPSSARASSSV